MKQYNLNLLILTSILAAVLAAVMYLGNMIAHKNWIWLSLGFYTVLSWASFRFTQKAIKFEHNRFISRFLFLTFSRIILLGIFLAIYLIISPQRDPGFIVMYMLLYLFYTLFEIYFLRANLRAEKYESVEDTNS